MKNIPMVGRLISCRSFLTKITHLMVLGTLISSAASAVAAYPAHNAFDATNGDEARQSALQSIPFAQLDTSARDKVELVLANVSVFRRMPIRVVESDPNLFHFLVSHPDVVVNIWEALGASQIQLREISQGTYRARDNAGTVGIAQVLYETQDTHVIYAEGCYQGPLVIRPAKGRCLLILKTGSVRQPDGRWFITARLDSFLNLESGTAELLTKAFEPLMGKIADANFTQSVSFIGSLSQTAQTNPLGVQRLAGKLEYVQPQLRTELAVLAERIAANAPPVSERTVRR